ncbi:OmpP1/FadL family transporter [Neolewinella antarctica]|uniref:Uncharacterized protein n=1 Tax=Neolewinella antarctica TaxID=442734 RepID=A0ABX0XEU5_9BACT|nr:outer membrane protein transport protein [Neolewinella antarctica]NJC27411.1 hypothetical protein [Neolewinella antarctica]
MTRLPLLAAFFLCLFGADAFAQADPPPRFLPVRVEDALRFGNTNVMGSARFMGTGGSMTPIGVDFTSLHTNPAGIGWNRSSYAALSAGFANTATNANLRRISGSNESTSESAGSFSVPSAGLVWSGDTRSLLWPTLNFGFSFTRLADYNETINYGGQSQGSIIDAIVEDFIDLYDADFGDTGEGFRADLILDIEDRIGEGALLPFEDDRILRLDELGFYSEFNLDVNEGAEIERSGTVERSGSMNELAFGVGGNYDNKVLWGLSIGIPFMQFTENKTYQEIDRDNQLENYEDASFNESLELDGTGANFKLGAIYLPTPEARVSVSLQTPTFWTIDETYFTDLEYNYTADDEARGGNALSPVSQAVVNLRTPWQFNAGFGYLINRKGFLSADVNYTNFAGNEFSTEDFATLEEAANDDIDATLKSSINVRVGGEINIDPLQVRAGVGYRTVPTQDFRYDESESLLTYSGGVGYNAGKFFVDVAARYEGGNAFYAPYKSFDFEPQVVDTDRSRITGVITVGFRGF